MGRPCLRVEYLQLLKAAHEAGMVTDADYEKRVRGLPSAGFVNLRTLEFIKGEFPDALPETEYKKLLRRLRGERDADINPMNRGLEVEALRVGAITKEEFARDVFWHVLKRPLPWAMEEAGKPRDTDGRAKDTGGQPFIDEGRYLAELRVALCKLDRRLAEEAYDAGLIPAAERRAWEHRCEVDSAVIAALLRALDRSKR
jgi:hypothetical protein